MPAWTRTRLARLRRRANELLAQIEPDVPTEIGGPFLTPLSVQEAAEQMRELAAAARDGRAITNAQASAVLAVLDANAEAREQAAADFGAGYATGQQASYNPYAAEYDRDLPYPTDLEPGPEW